MCSKFTKVYLILFFFFFFGGEQYALLVYRCVLFSFSITVLPLNCFPFFYLFGSLLCRYTLSVNWTFFFLFLYEHYFFYKSGMYMYFFACVCVEDCSIIGLKKVFSYNSFDFIRAYDILFSFPF